MHAHAEERQLGDPLQISVMMKEPVHQGCHGWRTVNIGKISACFIFFEIAELDMFWKYSRGCSIEALILRIVLG